MHLLTLSILKPMKILLIKLWIMKVIIENILDENEPNYPQAPQQDHQYTPKSPKTSHPIPNVQQSIPTPEATSTHIPMVIYIPKVVHSMFAGALCKIYEQMMDPNEGIR